MSRLRHDIQAMVDRLEPSIRVIFLAAVADIKSEAQEAVIIGAIQRGDFEAVFQALNLRPEFFAPLDEALRGAYLAGGQAAMASLPALRDPLSGVRVVLRFDGRNGRAERYLAEQSSDLITGKILPDTRDGIRAYITNAEVSGRGPRETALDIIGRINKLTGRREGGLVGLTSQQMEFVRNMRADLADLGNAEGVARYRNRKARDMRFDRTVDRAIREGKQLTAKQINKIADRYSDNLLKLRGQSIARTETLRALNASQYESILQTVDTGIVRPDQVKREWRTSRDGRVRDSHTRMNGETRGLYERFSNGCKFPGDPAGGAAQSINCRCSAITRIRLESAAA